MSDLASVIWICQTCKAIPYSITRTAISPTTLYLTESWHHLLFPCQTASWHILEIHNKDLCVSVPNKPIWGFFTPPKVLENMYFIPMFLAAPTNSIKLSLFSLYSRYQHNSLKLTSTVVVMLVCKQLYLLLNKPNLFSLTWYMGKMYVRALVPL